MTAWRPDLTRPGTIYLLCFDRPFGHARHYLGWAEDLAPRLKEHGTTNGARLLWHVGRAGIDWTLVRTWTGTRNDERQLKQRGHTRYCPRCVPGLRIVAFDGRPAKGHKHRKVAADEARGFAL